MSVDIRQAVLPVAAETIDGLLEFYGEWGLTSVRTGSRMMLAVDAAQIAFTAADEAAFHHFALQVPGDRFAAARTWLAERARLLSEAGRDEVTFAFEHIDAEAVYVHDPAGNIVELIAFHDLDRNGLDGPFDARELLGIAEVGLVVSDRTAAISVLGGCGLDVWQAAQAPERLQFVGQRAHSLILALPGRGWLPTDRPAEPWAASVDVRIDQIERTVIVDGGELHL